MCCELFSKRTDLGLYKENDAITIQIFPYGTIQFMEFEHYKKFNYRKAGGFLSHEQINNCLFLAVYSWVLCQKLIDHISMGFFLGSLYCSTNLSIFLPVSYSFDYYNFVL